MQKSWEEAEQEECKSHRITEVMNLVFPSAQSTKSEFTVDPGE